MPTISQRPGGANVPPFDEVQDTRKFTIVRDEFTGGLTTTGNVGDNGWTITQITGDSGPAITVQDGQAGKVGIVRLSTGSTTPAANDEGGLSLASGRTAIPTVASGNLVYATGRVSLPSIAGVEVRFGLGLATAARSADSVLLEFDASANAKWRGVTTASSSSTVVANTSLPDVAASTWYDLEVAASRGSAYFWVNGEYVGTTTATIPSVATLVPIFKVFAEGAAEKFVDIDTFMLRIQI